jgi:hypothetical protein
VFHDASHVGVYSDAGPGFLEDTTQRWLVDEFAPLPSSTGPPHTGFVRYSDVVFPIVSNTANRLVLTGDPSLLDDPDGLGYFIVPPVVQALTQLLSQATFSTQTAFAQVPTSMPCFSIRLERDTQAEVYLGESVEQYVLNGVEADVNRTTMTGGYLISIWAVNRVETLWLYAWLSNYFLQSMQTFATWGLSDVSLAGSDLDPALQYLPERTYVRHLLFTATRDERAINAQDVEYVTSYGLQVIAHYARLLATIPQPLP